MALAISEVHNSLSGTRQDEEMSARNKRSRVDATPKVKNESSPSPSPTERRLVTCGVKRYAPIPRGCLSSRPGYRQSRSGWVARCVKELEDLNLIPERKMIRDDGLIIDWKSHVPVWSDTLKPDTQDLAATITLAHRSNAQWQYSPGRSTPISEPASPATKPASSSIQEPSRERLPRPPRIPLKRRSSSSRLNSTDTLQNTQGHLSSRSEKPRPFDRTKSATDQMSSSSDHIAAPSNQRSRILVTPKPSNTDRGPSIASCTSSTGEEEMAEMTLNYLHRYMQTFESDRASLASAYASHASFAYRIHQIVLNSSGSASSICLPQSFSSGSKRSRLEITTTLLTLPGLHSNGQSPNAAKVEYDMFYLGKELGMIVVCRVATLPKTVVHNFILRRTEVDVEDATTEGVWSLTAAAHQILVFQS